LKDMRFETAGIYGPFGGFVYGVVFAIANSKGKLLRRYVLRSRVCFPRYGDVNAAG
jgi:hypothetical protein